MIRLTLLTLVISAVAFSSTSAAAKPPRGVFPAEFSVASKALVRNGVGLAEWGFFSVDLYWAALYLEERTSDVAQILDRDKAKSIQLYFVRELSREQMVKAYRAAFEVNAGKRLPEYERDLAALTAALTKVRVKDRLVFDYAPESGLRMTLNGRRRVAIKNQDFARMFFRLYVGKKPPTEALRKALVGRWKPTEKPRTQPVPKAESQPKSSEQAGAARRATSQPASRPQVGSRPPERTASRPTTRPARPASQPRSRDD